MKKELLEKEYSESKNIIVTGDVSVGKTTKIIFPFVEKMMSKKESMLIIDSKEEYISRYYDDFKREGYNTIILNLRELEKSDGWNPLEYPYNLYKNGNIDKALEYVEKLGKTIFFESGNMDPFWLSTSSDFFTGVTLGLFEDGKEEEINLNSISLMFNSVDRRFGISDYLTQYFNFKNNTSQPYIYAAATMFAPRETKGSILSVARQKLRLYVTKEKLSLLLSKTTFNYDEIANKPTVIFVIAKDENRYLNTVVSMFVEQLYSILLDLKVANKFNFVLDNFDIVERYNNLTDMLGSCISRNMKFVIGTRSSDNLFSEYGAYIKRLCNVITITNDIIEIGDKKLVNQDEEIEEKESNVVYPVITNTNIQLFDLEEFVNSNEKNSIFKGIEMPNLDPKKENNININIDDLIKKIDDKIAELDAMEKNEIKSEISQFKIDE